MSRLNLLYLVVLLIFLLITGCIRRPVSEPPRLHPASDINFNSLSQEQKRLPEYALAGMQVAEGLEVTLFAAEPMLQSPTNMAIDHKGRVWVTEVVNYFPDINPSNPYREEGDRILILEDTDRDGTADRQTVFYQGPEVNMAVGIAVLGNKAIVSAGQEVYLFSDEDGDDKADHKEVLFTGFRGGGDHGVHAFIFGPDGRLYFNFGDAGGQIHDRAGNLIVDLAGNEVTDRGNPYRRGMVFRCDPDGTNLEVLGYNFRNPYEVAVDSYGTLWQSDNDDDGNRSVRINYVMEYGNYGFTDEMTGAGWHTRRTNLEKNIFERHWHQNDPGVVPNLLITGAGSPAGMLVYEGTLMPSIYQGQIIHADAGPNVVRAYPVEPDGAGYRASVVDILRTNDQWFRPVDVAAAPDGSLFVADWYDSVVGGGFKSEQSHGRIYRIAPEGVSYTSPSLDLNSVAGAVSALNSPNMDARYLAWQYLHQMQEAAEPELLKKWRSGDSRSRARALWVLSTIEGLGERYLREALHDRDVNIRITGLRAARMSANDVLPYIRDVVQDPSVQVRREAAIALRHHPSPEAASLWSELALQYEGDDRWYLEAIGIGADRQWDRFFDAWLQQAGENWNTPSGRDIIWRARTVQALPFLAELIKEAVNLEKPYERYFRAFDFHPAPLKDEVLIDLIRQEHPEQVHLTAMALQHMSPGVPEIYPELNNLVAEQVDELRGTHEFVSLIRQFELSGYEEALLDLARQWPDSTIGIDAARYLLDSGEGEYLQQALLEEDISQAEAMVRVLGNVGSSEAKQMLWELVVRPDRDPDLRSLAVQLYGRGWGGEDMLLKRIREGELPPELSTAAASILFTAYRTSVREEAGRLLDVPGSDRPLPVVAHLILERGDPSAGRTVFERLCMQCHRVNNEGINFGPDLSQIGNKLPREGIYMAILNPDAGINFGYEGYAVELTGGSRVVGLKSGETPDAIEMRLPGNVVERIYKSDITTIVPLENSMMPSGLHRAMSEKELLDLVEYLMTLK